MGNIIIPSSQTHFARTTETWYLMASYSPLPPLALASPSPAEGLKVAEWHYEFRLEYKGLVVGPRGRGHPCSPLPPPPALAKAVAISAIFNSCSCLQSNWRRGSIHPVSCSQPLING